MQTQYIPSISAAAPWLERFSEDGENPLRTPLEKFPFTIGRSQSADLQIDSIRVSREHAVIFEKSPRVYSLRDLNSTNGTFVNGQRIQEVELQDGDLIAVANFELTFFSNHSGALPYAMTQMMTACKFDSVPRKRSTDLLQSLRLSGEALLQGLGAVRFDPFFALRDGAIRAYEADTSPDEAQLPAANARRPLLDLNCTLALRLRHVDRLLAVEQSMRLAHDGPIVFRLTPVEASADSFFTSVCAFERIAQDAHPLIFAIPYQAAIADADFREKVRRSRDAGIGLAVCDFPAAGRTDLFHSDDPPTWLIFQSGLFRALAENPQVQKELHAITARAADAGAEVVAVGVRSAAEAELCRDCGCRLAQGSWRGNGY